MNLLSNSNWPARYNSPRSYKSIGPVINSSVATFSEASGSNRDKDKRIKGKVKICNLAEFSKEATHPFLIIWIVFIEKPLSLLFGKYSQ